jgi:hypothetical protein
MVSYLNHSAINDVSAAEERTEEILGSEILIINTYVKEYRFTYRKHIKSLSREKSPMI